ncbi:DAR GTPase 2, mitochondrial-like [Musa acuminata AAA Group]|uniref:DAR GTPase 2, mitochondrial-like n=1 Tax=Musa acuminata AAA Group TaxID=214697 RepID=UPI0031DF6275
MATLASFSSRLGAVVRELASKKGPGGWYGRHMAAAERAILERIPLVDLVVEVRDARIPSTSAFKCLRKACCSHKQVIVLNKVDLADNFLTERWLKHFKNQNYITYGLNAHNKDSIKELLRILRARVKELKVGESNYTATILLTGIPNVGKSAIANSMHQIGRIGAAEKGKLKHAVVNPHPGETKDISSYKIASHPNLYVLDSPGILRLKIAHNDMGAKLALTGAMEDFLIGEYDLARYFLAILNLSEEYKRWEKLKDTLDDTLSSVSLEKHVVGRETVQRKSRQYPSDHTQDFIVKDVRQTLFKTISSFEGHLEEENNMEKIIESQFIALQEALKVSSESSEDRYKAVAVKLLNLYRTGRLGRYTLDLVSSEV